MKQAKGSQFIRFFKPVLEVLKESGGSGTAAEIIDQTIEKMKISEEEQKATNKNGESRVRNQVNWARLYLVRAGYLDSSKRGIWSLTEKGMSLDLAPFDVLGTFKHVHKLFRDEKKSKGGQEELFEDDAVEHVSEPQDHRAKLLSFSRRSRLEVLRD